MRKIRVLIVDDSSFSRKALIHCLSKDPTIEISGTASDGYQALELVETLQPDLITLDVEMPEMDGLATLRLLRKSRPFLPVIMCSALTERGAATTLEALSEGATCYVTKPSQGRGLEETLLRLEADLLPKVKALGPIYWSHRQKARGGATTAQYLRTPNPRIPYPPPSVRKSGSLTPTGRIDLLVIAASTGGPAALATLLAGLPRSLPVPVAIVQHMPAVFTKLLAQRLSEQSQLRVEEANHGQALLPGTVLLAPGGFHLRVTKRAQSLYASLDQEPPNQFCRPSANCLFESAAQALGAHVLGVVLTGMGNDGSDGCRAIRDQQGQVIAQDENSSVIWGMPRSVIELGLADTVLPMSEIAREIRLRVARSRSLTDA